MEVYLLDLERTIKSGITHYWKLNRHGYVTDINEAGLFPYEMALAICQEDFDKRTMMIQRGIVDKLLLEN